MSTKRRITSGTGAFACSLLLNLFIQLAMVPVFLSNWDVQTYGAWLSISGLLALVTFMEFGFAEYVGFHCLSQEGNRLDERSRAWSNATAVGLLTSSMLLLVAVAASTLAYRLLNGMADEVLLRNVLLSALIQLASWPTYVVFNGMATRVLSSVGDAPLTVWLMLIPTAATPIFHIIGFQMGVGLVGLALLQVIGIGLVNLPLGLFFVRRLSSKGIRFSKPDFRAGFALYRKSFRLSLAFLLETLQQTGFRIVLAPLAGAVGVAHFSTMRTVANTAQQAINTSTFPIVPDMIRFAVEGRRDHLRAMYATMWSLVVVLLAPAVVVLQFVAPHLYAIWTKQQFAWDGPTFAMLTLAIIVNGLYQPYRSIVRGNNLLDAQLWASLGAGATLLLATWMATARFGLIAAAAALLASELVRLGVYVVCAGRWLAMRDLRIGWRLPLVATAIGALTMIGVLVLAYQLMETLAALLAFGVVWALLCALYFACSPSVFRFHISKMLAIPWSRSVSGE